MISSLSAWMRETLEGARLAQSITVTTFFLILAAPLWAALAGTVAYASAVAALAAIAAASLFARREAIVFSGAIPFTLLVFVTWAALSTLWSERPAETALRVAGILAIGFLGLYVALARDTIQIVRALGLTLRALLLASLILELLVGIMFDTELPFLGIAGNLDQGGPIQGVFGARSLLAFASLIALFTFAIEWRTRTLETGGAVFSVSLAVVCLVFAGSHITWITLAVVLVASAALYALRHTAPALRWRWQLGIIIGGLVTVGLSWIFRARLIETLDTRSEVSLRVEVWQELSRYLGLNPVQGWGFSGQWWSGAPYTWVRVATDRNVSSGLNAYVDVYFQLGVVGLVLLLAVLGTALVRSWLLASNRRSVIYVWPALMLVTLVTISLADSFVVTGAGWMLLVLSASKAAREMTWREAWTNRTGGALPLESGR